MPTLPYDLVALVTVILDFFYQMVDLLISIFYCDDC